MSSSAEPSPPPAAPDSRRALAAWYLRDMHRALWTIPLWAVLAVFLLLMILRNTFEDPTAKLPESIVAARALQPAPVESTENAATDYQNAFATYIPWNGTRDLDPTVITSCGDAAYYESPAVQTYLKNNEPAIGSLLTAAKKGLCNFELDYALGFTAPLPHLGKMRNATRLLATSARAKAYAGDHAGAARALAAAMALARHAESDRFLIAELVATAADSIALAAIENILQRDPPRTVEELQAYRDALGTRFSPEERMARSLEGEKVIGLVTFDRLAAKGAWTAFSGSSTLSARGFSLPWYGGDRRSYARVMDEMITMARSGEIAKIKDENEIYALIRKHQEGPLFVTSLSLPVFSRSYFSFTRVEELARVTDAGLAFLQFRAKHGRDAQALEELVPEFLKEVPRGIHFPEPLRMRIDPKGVTVKNSMTGNNEVRLTETVRIYTLGENGRDDDGYSEQTGNREIFPQKQSSSDQFDDANIRLPVLKKDESKSGEGGK